MIAEKEFNLLREKALKLLETSKTDDLKDKFQDFESIIHELQVNHIELQLQSEELQSKQAKLEASRDEYYNLFHSAPVGYLTLDENGMILEANQSFDNLVCSDVSNIYYSSFIDFIHKDDKKAVSLIIKQNFERKNKFDLEIKLVNLRKETVPVKIAIKPFRTGNTKAAFLLTVTNLTYQKTIQDRLENELEISKKLISLLEKQFDISKRILALEDFPVTARAVFDHLCQLTGAVSGYVALLSEDGAENELLFLESGGLKCTVDENLPMPIRGLREVAYNKKEVVYHNDFMNSRWLDYMPGGHVVLKNVLFAPMIIEGKAKGIIGIANKPGDFNEEDSEAAIMMANLAAVSLQNSQILQEIKMSKERLSLAIEGGSLATWNWNLENDSILINERFRRIIELREDKPETITIDKWLDTVHPQDKLIFSNQISHIKNGRSERLELELRIVQDDGNVKWAKTSGKVLSKDEDNKAVLVAGTMIDISKIKIAEMKLQEKATAMKCVIDDLKLFTHTISHDMKTPLRHLTGLTEILQENEEINANENTSTIINAIYKSSSSLQNLFEGIVKLSKLSLTTLSLMQTDLSQMVTSEITRLVGEDNKIKLQHEIEPNITVYGDPTLLRLVFTNLIGNSIKYARDGVDPVIKFSQLKKGEETIFCFTDNGIGIDPGFIDNVFLPFRKGSSKAQVEGLGLGLSTVKRIIDRHGGKIWVESEVGKGTKFYFTLAQDEKDLCKI